MDFIKLTHEKLSVDEAMQSVTAPNCGAVSLFVGTTRDNFDGKKVLKLEYEAYEPMAEKSIKQICTEMRQKWTSIEHIAIFHRLGTVPVKESSVVIAISSPHRADALEATQWSIETLKKTVPIWKKEVYEESEAQWKENSECKWSKTSNKNNKVGKPKFDFLKHVQFPTVSSSHLVQINCTNEELQRRMDTFMKRKRDQANITNITDYCGARNADESCARIDAVLMRPKNAKSHLRMHRVYNTYGPYNTTKSTAKVASPFVSKAIEQRLSSVEQSLDIIKPVSPDIYSRLKQIEDRILYLESVSPEYAHFWNKDAVRFGNTSRDISTEDQLANKRKYTVQDVDRYIFELEELAHTKSTKPLPIF